MFSYLSLIPLISSNLSSRSRTCVLRRCSVCLHTNANEWMSLDFCGNWWLLTEVLPGCQWAHLCLEPSLLTCAYNLRENNLNHTE
jgi:hypothetical protein